MDADETLMAPAPTSIPPCPPLRIWLPHGVLVELAAAGIPASLSHLGDRGQDISTCAQRPLLSSVLLLRHALEPAKALRRSPRYPGVVSPEQG